MRMPYRRKVFGFHGSSASHLSWWNIFTVKRFWKSLSIQVPLAFGGFQLAELCHNMITVALCTRTISKAWPCLGRYQVWCRIFECVERRRTRSYCQVYTGGKRISLNHGSQLSGLFCQCVAAKWRLLNLTLDSVWTGTDEAASVVHAVPACGLCLAKVTFTLLPRNVQKKGKK
jgi:hypothetical protein